MPTPIVFPPDCEAVVRALWDYLDQRLEQPQIEVIDAHLADCEYCRAHFAFERQLVDQLHALRLQHQDPVKLKSRILAAIRGVPAPETK